MPKWILTAAAALVLVSLVGYTIWGGEPQSGSGASSPHAVASDGPTASAGATLVPAEGPETRGSRAALDGVAATERAVLDADAATHPVVGAHGSLAIEVQRMDGSPVSDMALFVEPERDERPVRVERLRTDAEGRARIDTLAPGAYSVSSVRGPSGDVTVVADEEASLVLKLKGRVDVRGLVVAPDGRPIQGAEVWLLTLRNDWRGKERIAVTDTSGAFAVRDVPQRYSLGANARGFGPSAPLDLELVQQAPLGAGHEPTELRLELTADGGSLVGVVSDSSGAPIAGALVAAGAPATNVYGMRSDTTMAEHWGAQLAETGADGRYALLGLPPGAVPLAVEARDFPVARHTVEVLAGATVTRDVTFVLGTQVEGVVRTADGAAVAGALVIQLDAPFVDPFPSQGPTDGGAPFVRPRTRSGADGRFVLGPFAPGEVHLYAAKGTTYWDDEGAQFVGTAQTSLVVTGREPLRWDPVLTLGLRIHGRVTYANGKPMKELFISARPSEESQRGAGRTERTGADGEFSITGLEDREYTVDVQLWERPPGSKPLRQAGVRPSETPLLLVADHDAPAVEGKATLRARIVDDAQRLEGRGALVFDAEMMTYHPNLADGVYSSEVAPGRYRARVLVGDTAVGISDYAEVGPGEVHDFGDVRTVAAASIVCSLARAALTQKVHLSLRAAARRSYSSTALSGDECVHTFGDLLPGEYVLSLWGMGVAHTMRTLSVRAGEKATVDLALQPGVHRMIHIDAARPAGWGRIDVTVRGDDGALRHASEYDERWVTKLPVELEVMLPAGRFTVEARAADGRTARGELALDAPSVASGEVGAPLRIVLE
jgi:hypothetical protein